MIPLRFRVNFSFYLATVIGIYVICALLLDYVPEMIDLIYGQVTAQPTASSALSPLLSPRSINTPLIIALFLIVLNPSLPVLSRLDQALLDRFSDRVRIPTSQTPFRDSLYGLVIIFLIAIALTVIMVPGVHILTLLDTPFEWYLGGIFVCVNAYRKFNTPATNRSTTTFAQFVIYGLLYCLAMALIYLFLTAVLDSSPETIQIARNFLNIAGQGNALDGIDFVNQSKPFISALLVITVLPNAPWIKNFDRWLLQVFWDFGRIPYFVTQQAESLRQAGYIIDPGKRKDLVVYATKYGIDIDVLALGNRDKGDFKWAKLASLQLSLDRWRSGGNDRTQRFISDNEREYSLIKNTVDDLSYQFANNRPGKSRNEASKAALEKEITATYKRLTDFVARILLISEHSQSNIRRRSQELGFGDLDFHSRSLSVNQMVLILVSMFASFLILSFLFNRVLSDYPRTMLSVLNESLLLMMTYGAAVTCALIIKDKPVFSFNELTSQRPWRGYFLSGMLAIGTWLVVAWSYRYIELMLRSPVGGDKTMVDSLVGQVLAHLEWSYPYILQSFVIAVGLSFLVDRRIPSNKKLVAKTKIADTAFLMILMIFISLVVYQWMFGIFLFDGLQTKAVEYIKPDQFTWTAQLSFALEHGIIGAVIGFLVPHWYRTNRSRASGEIASRAILMNRRGLSAEIRNLVPNQLIRAVAAIAASVVRTPGNRTK